jgi:hypothetical protein
MKKQLLVALMASTAIVSTVKAQSIDPNHGLLFFRSDSVTKNVVIDIGSIPTLGAFTFDNTGLNTILNTTYGANWYSKADIRWGIVASDFTTTSSVFDPTIDNGDGTFGDYTISIDHSGTGAFTRTGSENRTLNAQQGFDLGNMVMNLGNTAVAQAAVAATVGYSTATGGGSFNYYVYDNSDLWSASSLDASGFRFFLQAIGNNSASNTLYTYNTDSNPVSTGLALTVNNADGTVSVVPEPSTYALMGFGALLLIIAYRRKSA